MILDTCEAMSLFDVVTAPNLILMGTSIHDQPAKSYQWDPRLNTWLNDHFTYHLALYLRDPTKFTKKSKVHAFPSLFPKQKILSNVDIKSTLQHRALEDVRLADYMPLPSEVDNGSKYFNIEDGAAVELLQ
jgi:glycosylphosphatidylinositol transamidase (GPIT) subunit GPI8